MAKKFTSKLLNLNPGQIITIFGKTFDCANMFEVELTEDARKCDVRHEIPFHMSVKFIGSGIIVRNSLSAGKWETEEKAANRMPGIAANPIKPGEDFQISIYIDENIFYVSIDDKPFCTFKNRKSISAIKRLNIFGDVDETCRIVHTSAQSEDKNIKHQFFRLLQEALYTHGSNLL